MKIILSEEQYKKVIEQYKNVIVEYYEADKLYNKESIVKRLQKGPRHIKAYIKKLPDIVQTDSEGNERVMTKIPEVLYVYLFGNY
jgi:hypothetical protein